MMANYVYDTAQGAARAPGRAARSITQRSGSYSGKGLLAAELLVGFLIIAIRLVADYEIQEDGAVKGNVLHPQGQYGPFAILAGLIGVFFLLSFLAMSGGTRAKLAVIFGATIILALGIKSYDEIVKVSSTIGTIGKVTVPSPSGTLPDIYGHAGSGAESAVGGAAAPGQFASQAAFGSSAASAYAADVRALEKLNLVKVVGDSVVFVGDAATSVGRRILHALGL